MTFNILDPNQNIFQDTFLEASAGTGKTFAIQHLISRFLLEGEPPLKIDQILAITFTREAAKEMKERVQANLVELRAMLLERRGEGYLKNLTQEAAYARLEEAEVCFDRAHIYTIHGFCQKMLVEAALEASFPLQSSRDFDHRSLMRRAVKETLSDPGVPQWEIERLLKQSRMDFDHLVYLLVMEMENHQEEEDPKVQFIDALATFHNKKMDVQLFSKELYALLPLYKKMTRSVFAMQAKQLAQWACGSHPTQNEWAELMLSSEWFLEHLQEENLKMHADHPSSLQLRYYPFIQQMHLLLVPLWKKSRERKALLTRFASRCKKRFLSLKTLYEVYSPDEILEAMLKASQNPSFKHYIATKFRAVIVDEFQDTDPIQWSIIRNLFLKEETKPYLFLVGDPKQSIYGFRKADVYAYMEAYKVLGEESRFHLETNYRSRQELTVALNGLFGKVEGWLELPQLQGALQYRPVKAGRGKGRQELGAPIEFCLGKGSIGRSKTFPTQALEQNILFPFIAEKLIEHHQLHCIGWEQMAVLVKDRFQAQRMVRELKGHGIPASIKRSKHLTETRGFVAIQELLFAAWRPRDQSAFLKVALGPLVCVKLDQLTPAAFQNWSNLCQTLKNQGFISFYSAFLQSSFGLHTVYETLACDLELFKEVRQTALLLMNHSFGSSHASVSYLQQLSTLTPEEDERLELQDSEDEKSVSIMTLFGSKGLEFEIVFAPGLATRAPSQEEEDPEREAEKMRTLYVALTRAREKLYLPFFFEEGLKPPASGTAAPMEHFLAHLTQSQLPLEEKLVTHTLKPLETDGIAIQWMARIKKEFQINIESQPLIIPPSLEVSVPPFYIHSFTSLSQKSKETVPFFEGQDPSILPLGAHTGILIHLLFERLFQNGGYQNQTLLKQTVHAVLAQTQLEEWEEEVCFMAEKALKTPLVEEACLADLESGAFMQEMEFLFAEENQFIKGFADLVFQLKGKYYLLDWKTNWLGPSLSDYMQEKLKETMLVQDYFFQASLYTEALKRYVKQFYIEPFELHFGGAIYFFLRGNAPYQFNPLNIKDYKSRESGESI